MARLHLIAACVWIGLILPSLIWWRDSVLWVVLMSLYTIVVEHLGAYHAARAAERVKRLEGENGKISR